VNLFDTIRFAFQLIIVGAFFRFIELMFPHTAVGEALGVIY
jgi:hypothetical protein